MASLGCADTPVSFPSNFNLNSITPDPTTKLRLIPFAAGPLTIQVDDINSGITVDENPNTELLISNPENSKTAQYRYSQYDTRLYIPSSHKLPGVNSVAEYCIFFRNQVDSNKLVCLSLLLVKGADTDSTAAYFSAIGSQSDAKKPLLTTLFSPDDMFVEYVGADLRYRTKLDPTPTSRCDAPTFVTYFLCTTPIRIGGTSLARFYLTLELVPPTSSTTLPTPLFGATKPAKGPPQPTSAGTYNLIKYISLVKGLQIGYPNAAAGPSGSNGPQTSALKCYRIDPAKDISGGKVVIKSASAGTLAQELGGEEEKTGDSTKNTVGVSLKAGDVETYVAIAAGVVVCVLAVIGFYFYKFRPTEEQLAATKALQEAARRQTILDAGGNPDEENTNADAGNTGTTGNAVEALPKDSLFYTTIGLILGFIISLLLWLLFFADGSGNSAFTIVAIVGAVLAAVFGGSYFFYTYFRPPI